MSAIELLDWEDDKKKRVRKFFTIEYTSSDESELSEDERLSWESSRLRELKDLLDLTYKKSLSPHVRNFQTERVFGERFSSGGPPPNAPKWALKSGPMATSTPARGRH